MTSLSKLRTLTECADLDKCCECPSSKRINSRLPHVHKVSLPNGNVVPILKTLLTNVCINDCAYCPFRVDKNKEILTPKEMANIFLNLNKRKIAHGLFLSSGVIKDPNYAQEKIIETAKLVREHFHGYMHLKIMPGADLDLIKQTCELGSRVSVNIEAPNKSRLSEIASNKNFHSDILGTIKNINKNQPWAGQTTQLIVGAADESDKEIFDAMNKMYNKYYLKRVYYSAFNPIKNTPLESKEKTPSIRQHRLYQVDFLFRQYDFSIKKLDHALNVQGNLSLFRDPKQVIAPHILTNALDPNTASYQDFILVPGIGIKTASKIIEYRKNKKLTSMKQLKQLGVIIRRAESYIQFNSKQMRLNNFT